MPSKRLMLMGLLSPHTTKSEVLKRITTPHHRKEYTPAQREHICGVWKMPELSKNWVRHQFVRLGYDDPDGIMRRMKVVVYSPKSRKYWHIGERNLQFITQQEVELYYARYDRSKRGIIHPTWVTPIFLDHRKQGMTQRAIAEKYDIPEISVRMILKRNMFTVKYPNLKGRTHPFMRPKVDRQP